MREKNLWHRSVHIIDRNRFWKVCHGYQQSVSWDFMDSCTDHRFFCGQFCIWDGKDKNIFFYGSRNEPDYGLPFGNGRSGREFPFLFFAKNSYVPALYRDFSRHGILSDFCLFLCKRKYSWKRKEKEITRIEAILLAIVLSLDSLALGLGTGLIQTGGRFLVVGSFLGGIFMMEVGWKLGKLFGISMKRDLSWLSGACLILLAAGLWIS